MLPLGLTQIADILTGLEGQALAVSPRQCTRVRHRRSTCTLCADHCPTHALSWEGTLKVDAAKCNGCGICAALCPTGALEAQNPINAQLIEQCIQAAPVCSSITFACPKVIPQKRPDTILVNCLGRLDESILATAAAEGISDIRLVSGACEACVNATSRGLLEQAVERARGLAQSFGLRMNVTFIAALPEETEDTTPAATTDFSRRAFFNLLARETVRATTLTAHAILNNEKKDQPEVKPGDIPQRLPAKRQLLLRALQGLTFSASNTLVTGNWANFKFKETCVGCEMCAFFCPTGALSKTSDDGPKGLNFRASYCTNCRLCQEICHWQAVDLVPGAKSGRILEGTVESLPFPASAQKALARSSEDKLKDLVASLFKPS